MLVQRPFFYGDCMSKTQNQILAEIILALGGTVTNAGNRNALLEDWLEAIS